MCAWARRGVGLGIRAGAAVGVGAGSGPSIAMLSILETLRENPNVAITHAVKQEAAVNYMFDIDGFLHAYQVDRTIASAVQSGMIVLASIPSRVSAFC